MQGRADRLGHGLLPTVSVALHDDIGHHERLGRLRDRADGLDHAGEWSYLLVVLYRLRQLDAVRAASVGDPLLVGEVYVEPAVLFVKVVLVEATILPLSPQGSRNPRGDRLKAPLYEAPQKVLPEAMLDSELGAAEARAFDHEIDWILTHGLRVAHQSQSRCSTVKALTPPSGSHQIMSFSSTVTMPLSPTGR